MENENISAEERLKQINAERKELKVQVSSEREKRLKEASLMRDLRDKKQGAIKEKLDLILKAIFNYNKLGKVDKEKCEILEMIVKLTLTEGMPEQEPLVAEDPN